MTGEQASAMSGVSTFGRGRRAILLVLFLTVVIRLLYVGLLYHHPRLPGGEGAFRALIPHTWQKFYPELAADELFSDQESYDTIARSLLSGEGYRLHIDEPPTAFRAPVYPIFLAVLYAVAGESHLSARLANILMELGTVLLLIAVSRRIFRDGKTALLTGFLYALYLPASLYAMTLFSETIYTFILALFLYVFVRAREVEGGEAAAPPAAAARPPRGRTFRALLDRRWLAHLGAGVLLGVATLTKPTTLLLPPLFLAPILWRRRRGEFLRRDVVRGLLPLTLGMVLLLTPWTVRNYQVLGRLVPITTGGGRALWACNYVPSDDPMIPLAQRGVGRDSPAADRSFYQRAIANIADNPGTFARSAMVKFVRLWFNLGFDRPPSRGSVFLGGENMILAALMVAAILFFPGPWLGRASPIFHLLVYFSLVHIALIGYIRYALPVIPHLMIVSSYGALCLVRRLGRPGVRAESAPTTGIY